MTEKKTILQSLTYVGDDLFTVATNAGKYYLFHFRNDKIVEVYRTAPSMWLCSAFINENGKPSVMLMSQSGTTQLITPGDKPKKLILDKAGTGPGKRGYIKHIITYRNTVYIGGSKNQLYAFTNGTWVNVDDALLDLVIKEPEQETFPSINGLCLKKDSLLVLSNRNVVEFDGNNWKFIHKEPGHWYAGMSYSAHHDMIYLSGGNEGNSITCIDAQGHVEKVKIDSRYDIGNTQAVNDQLYLEIGVPFVGGQQAVLLENWKIVDIGSPVGVASSQRVHNVNGTLYFMGGKAGLFRYENNEWIAIDLPKISSI